MEKEICNIKDRVYFDGYLIYHKFVIGKMMIDMENIVNDLQTWQNGKAVLVHGANNIFCSGGDLDFVRQESNSQSGYDISTLMSKVLLAFSNLPLVSVAYLNGHGTFSY